MEELEMVPVNTHIGHGPTCFGTQNASQIDAVFMPKTLLRDITSAGPLRQPGRDLQIVATRQARDHVRVH
eukprot:409550-Pyramimonas_sp.AAC.1